MADASATVASTLPVLPPAPAGPEPVSNARGLAALIAALDDAVISYRGPHADAIVVIVGGRVLDAIAAPTGRAPVMGLDALNALSPADSASLHAVATDRRLALALPSYWREADRLPPISARWVDAGGLIEAMIRPGHRGAVVLRSQRDLGLALFDESGFIAAYSQAYPQPGGLETLTALVADAGTMIHGRIADASDASGGPVQERVESPPAALLDPIERCRGEILRMAEAALHLYAEPVADRFRGAPGTAAGLLLAAGEVREMQIRLVSSATMSSIAERAEQIVRAVSRGN